MVKKFALSALLVLLLPAVLPAASVRIRFLPPPMDGKVSLGLYNAEGKLVRVLHREAAIEDFAIEADGLGTRWDGNDDAGNPCPTGVYRAKGFLVGDLKVTRSGTTVTMSGSTTSYVCRVEPQEKDGKVTLVAKCEKEEAAMSSRTATVDGTLQSGTTGEVISGTSAEVTPEVSINLFFSDGSPFVSATTVALTLVKNSLNGNKAGRLEVQVAFDAEGSYLAAADGLPLLRVSHTAHVAWVKLGRQPGKTVLTIFENDGEHTERYIIARPERIMSFDAGKVKWTAAP